MIYDVAIIGGGPAGYLAAERASEAGLSVLLAEKNKLGGVCLNEGCIPTKALLHSAKSIPQQKEREALLHLEEHAGAMANKNRVVKTLAGGVTAALKAKKVTVVKGSAEVTKGGDRFEVLVGKEAFAAGQVLLATGSVPAIPPIDGLREGLECGFVMTSREILDIPRPPASLVIIGGGVVGLEMAVYFRAMGSRVTVLEALPAIGGPIEPEAAAFLRSMLERKGVELCTNVKVASVGTAGITIETAKGAKELPADRVLLSTGRRACLDGFEKLGVLVERGAVRTDDRMRTSVAGVYAAGDINGKYMLAHAAYREAEVAVGNMAGIGDVMEYRAIPGVVYTSPEVAYVGMTEQEAQAQFANIAARKAGINMNGRHVAEQGLSDGFCKLVADKDKSILLGATIVGAYASEVIYAVGLMIQNKIPIEAVKKTIFPHPTVGEIVREALFSI